MSIRKSNWKFKTSSSTAISAYFVGAQKSSFVLTRGGLEVTFNYAAAGAGLSAGVSVGGDFGFSASGTDNWSVGDIFMTNGFSGSELRVGDIEGACQIFDAGVGGGTASFSATVMALGIPTKRIPRQVWRTSLIGMATSLLSGDDDFPTDATALLMMTGVGRGSNVKPGASVMGSYGYAWTNVIEQDAIKLSPPIADDTLLLNSQATRSDLIYLPTDLLFDFDHHELKAKAWGVLEDVAHRLKFLKPSRIAIEGHADAIGTDSYNYGLSYRRAWSVADWLIYFQVFDAARISVVGLGHTRPIAPDRMGGADNPEGRARNRRVEVRLYWL